MTDLSLLLFLFSLVHVPVCTGSVLVAVVLVCFRNSSSSLPFLLMLHSFGSGNLVYSPCTRLVYIVFTICVRSCDIHRYSSM